MTMEALQTLRRFVRPGKTWWDIPSGTLVVAMIIAKSRKKKENRP